MIFAAADESGMTAVMAHWRSWSKGRKVLTVIVAYFAVMLTFAVVHPDPQPDPPAKWCQEWVPVAAPNGIGYTNISEKVLCH